MLLLLIRKKPRQAHLLDCLLLLHLRSNLVEIDLLLHVVTRETWTFLSHHVTHREKQALGSCWSCRNSKYTPHYDTQPREKMHSTVTPLVERILVLGKGDRASLSCLDLPVSDLCAWKVERIHSSSGKAVTKKSFTSSIESLTSVDASEFLTSSITAMTIPRRRAQAWSCWLAGMQLRSGMLRGSRSMLGRRLVPEKDWYAQWWWLLLLL